MDVSELKEWKIICEVRYPAAVRLFDVRASIVESTVTERLTEWRISRNRVDIFDKDQSVRYFASFKNSGSVMEAPVGVTLFRDHTVKFLRNTFEILGITGFERVGVRIYYLLPASSFEDLVQCFLASLYRLSNDDWKQAGGVPVDVGFPLTLQFGGHKANFTMGPMEKRQLVDFFDSEGVIERLPDVVTFADFDYYVNKPSLGKKKPDRFVREFIDLAAETSRKYTTRLLALVRYGEEVT